MMTWVTADTHFYHSNMVKLCGRPENFDELIIMRWKELIKNDDVVIHLGDVSWIPKKIPEIMAGLPGRKILVLGNHDKQSPGWYMRNGFDFAASQFTIGNLLFTHSPVQVLPPGVTLNIHGHTHNNPYNRAAFHRLVSLEETDYRPVALHKISR